MSETHLPQEEADALLAMPKVRESDDEYIYPVEGGSISVPLMSPDRRERFMLDIARGKIDLAREVLQNRARQVVILLRLETAGPRHRNPDGEEVSCPHIHYYREGFGDKFAYPVPSDQFRDLSDSRQTLEDFMRLCNITEPPRFGGGLFL